MTPTYLHPCSNRLFYGLLLLGFLLAGFTLKGFAAATSGGSHAIVPLENTAPEGLESAGAALNFLGFEPVISLDLNGNDMTTFNAAVGGSDTLFYYAEGFNFPVGETVTFTVNDASGPFTISFSSESGYGTSLQTTTDSNGEFFLLIWIKYAPTAEGQHITAISHASAVSVTVKLDVEGNTPFSLPAELLSFNAHLEMDAIELNWTTATEKNNSHFEVEMTQDMLTGFVQIGRVNSQATNSLTAIDYTFRHAYRSSAGTYYYRLKQIDVDHSFTYSKIVAISTSTTTGIKLQVAPNPLTPASQLCITTVEKAALKIVVLDMNGTAVYNQLHSTSNGERCIRLSLDDKLPAGMYILTAESKFGVKRLRLIKN